MAKKVKCASCGAKNDVGQHRCRVCTNIIDPAAAESLPKGLAKQRKLDERLAMAAERNQRPFESDELGTDLGVAGIARPPASGAPPIPGPSYGPRTDGSVTGGSATGVSPSRVSASGVSAGSAEPTSMASVAGPPVAGPVAGFEAAPEAGLPDDAIVIEAPPRHLAVPPPVTEAVDPHESWDAVGGIEIEVVGRNTSAPPPPIERETDTFDLNGLVIEPPR